MWAGSEREIKNCRGGKVLGQIRRPGGGAITARVSQSSLSSRLWDIECGACLRVLEGHEELVRCIRFDNKRIVSGAYDGWVLHIAMLCCACVGGKGLPSRSCVCRSRAGQVLCTGGGRCYYTTWSGEATQAPKPTEAPKRMPFTVTVNQTGSSLGCAGIPFFALALKPAWVLSPPSQFRETFLLPFW